MKLIAYIFISAGLFLVPILGIQPAIEEKVVAQETKIENTSRAKMLFIGDMMFDRTIRTAGERHGYDSLFSCTRGYLLSFDLVVGNLEGPVTDQNSVSVGAILGDPNNMRFTFDEIVPVTLAKANIKAVNIGNNHIDDSGTYGMESTVRSLDEVNIGYFGAPAASLERDLTLQGFHIALVGFNQFLGPHDPQKTIDAIVKARHENDFVAVYAHWGEEYATTTEYQRDFARRFIDAGADAVFGSHPHVIQDHEVYKGKNIYYSLGNFIFDQYWNADVKKGMGVEVTLGGNDPSYKEVYFDVEPAGTCISR